MMKKLFALLAVLACLLGCLAGCETGGGVTEPQVTQNSFIDYAGQVKLDMSSDTLKQEVTVKSYVDGDTTHFYVPESIIERGFLKARYLGVNTPESTGKIEEWGKKASNFTKERLQSAESIIIESDDGNWNLDSTGDRHLVWVWYKTQGAEEYRNLNIEILQNGLAATSKTSGCIYEQACMDALMQAKDNKLNVHSGEKDPDFYYGGAIPVTLKELRLNAALYENTKVAFEAVVAAKAPQTAYVEEYDEETDMYYGMTAYYGYALSGKGQEIMEIGNRVLVVGSVQSHYDSWQVTDIQYVAMRPDDPMNIQLISEGHEGSYRVTDPIRFVGSTDIEVRTSLEDEEATEIKTVPYASLMLNATIGMENLKVSSIYTTQSTTDSDGAMTLTCKAPGGVTISVRTLALFDENGEKITSDAYQGKTINVRGIVDCYNGSYQIKVLNASDITVIS